jgi:signal transduction histidine kinase
MHEDKGLTYPQDMGARTVSRYGLMRDLAFIALVVFLSWLAGRHLFASSFNPVADRHLSLGLWVTATCLAAFGFIAARHWLPEVGVALGVGAAVLHTQYGWPLLPADLLAVAAICVAARRRSPLLAVASLVAAVSAAYVATGQTEAGYRDPLPDPFASHGGFPAVAGLLVVAWFLGAMARRLDARIADAERQRDREARLATERERARISREIHDVVAHGLSVMVVQAQGAASTLDRRPERTAEALEAIISTGRSSLAEMRRLLENHEIGQSAADVAAPGLDQLGNLIGTATQAGLPTALDVEGQRRELPPDVDAAAFRIIQEALTNALRHAGSEARASVRLAFCADSLDVQVTDTGTGSNGTSSGGHGLEGIRQRVALLGGRVHAGDLPGRGFQVDVQIPLPHST